MSLTPEEVVNKRFQITKFREGYDQDEVDDFLDQIVVELRRLTQANAELNVQLSAASSSPAVDAETPDVILQAAVINATVPSAADANNSHSLLELARKLHEEHVREGLTKRDQLIRDGQENAARLVRDAEAQAKAVIGQLELDRKAFENTIDDLREFEQDYRARLHDYIETQLRALVREESFDQPLEAVKKIDLEETSALLAAEEIVGALEAAVEDVLEDEDDEVGERS
jgi:DivIVA domain-containing protein